MNRPYFHIAAAKGWINDPNGLVKFRGRYHVFFQSYPDDIHWGPMHWGHVVSDDLLHYEILPNALTPGDPFDQDGCFSGSALAVGEKLILCYTGFINAKDPKDIRQIQCLAESEDGVHFHKLGCILDEKDLPAGYDPSNFRDPKLLKDEKGYLILAAGKHLGGSGAILRFRSSDLKNWKFDGEALYLDGEADMIECPDYHPELNLLTYCEQSSHAPSLNPSSNRCYARIGRFDEQGKFVGGKKQLLDYGFDFYAPQSYDGEDIMLGWLNAWGHGNPNEKEGYVGTLSCPRRLSVKDGVLLQTPIVPGKLIAQSSLGERYEGELLAGAIHITAKGLEELELILRKGKGEESVFKKEGNQFVFDRSHSGKPIEMGEQDEDSLRSLRRMEPSARETTDLWVILDKFSLEFFVNGIAMSNQVFPKEYSQGYEIQMKASKAEISVYAWDK